MIRNMEGDGLYLKGEEKFGYISARFYSLFSGMATWKPYRQIIDHVIAINPNTVLDVGCGPGDVILKLAERMKNTKFLGIDPSQNMVDLVNKRSKKRGLEARVGAEIGSSRQLKNDRKFDMIIASFSFHHWKMQKESLSYLTGKVESGGRISIFDLNAEGFYGHFPVARKHTLSGKYGKTFTFYGFTTKISYSSNFQLIILEFLRK